jgi:ABC-type sugar transport system ATPase subunit
MDANAHSTAPLVRFRGITKRFENVTVLHDVSLDIFPGEVLVLAGENGAGKSTLIKILGGVHTHFEGTLELDGHPIAPQSPLEANDLGISVIFQELSLVPSMTVADNIFLGRPITRAGFQDDKAQRTQARELLARLGLDIDVTQHVEDLPIATQQLTEIAKALARNAKVIVMDEPTSSLNAPEVEHLFKLIADLKSRGCAIVYISHKMEEIERIADRITVLRDGRFAGTGPASEVGPQKLVHWMVGREMGEQFKRQTQAATNERFRLESFCAGWKPATRQWTVENISLTLRAGEILGIAGVQGSGNSELFLALFGGTPGPTKGRAFLDGQPFDIRSPRHAINQGVALLTNDRKATGLVLTLSIIANATLADLPRLSPGGWRHPDREVEAARDQGRALSLRAASLDMETGVLSGGNQQKVALAKWLQTSPRVLLLDEPTRGIDVGAKFEIYQLLDTLTARGIAILLITSELPELLALSDRILVMHRGHATGEFTRQTATAERILEAAMGKTQTQAQHS